jgi:hypothetical protein
MTLNQIKEQLKSEYPTLKSGSEEIGYTELSTQEYEATINAWAENAYAKELKAQEAEAQAEAKAALLNRLGITADEAKLLLG